MAFATAVLAGPHDALIAKHAAANGVPEHLVQRVIRIESGGNAAVSHAGNYGLMQIRLGTARGVGYAGDANGLLDPDTNLTYAVRYLAGAYRLAGCDEDRAVSYYQRGYYRAAQHECVAPSTALMQVAQAETKAKARRRPPSSSTEPAATEIKSDDVIKPKVVRTETIVTPRSGLAPARPLGKFEPARVAPPPVLPAAVNLELASVPLPPVRPVFDPAPNPAVQPAQHTERIHNRAERKPKAGTRSQTAAKPDADSNAKAESKFKMPDPTEVVSYLKKLVTPDKDKKPRRRAVEAEADPPSFVQPPQ